MTDPADLVLALDSGSQSSRALLFDRDGVVLASAARPHQPMRYPEEGAVEQEPGDIRDALFGAIKDCLDGWGGDRSRIAAAAMTTQRSVVIAADADGVPLRDAVSWLDRRSPSIESEPWVPLRFGLRAMGKDGLLPRLLGRSLPRLWRERSPKLLEEARWIVPLEAWLHHQLCGRMAVAPGGLPGAWPFDIKKRTWFDGGLMYRLLGFESRWLAEIVEAGSEIGRIHAAASEATGLPEGTPIFACGGDKQAEALGAGVRPGSAPGTAAVSLGTGSSICVVTSKPHESLIYKWVCNAFVEPGLWTEEYMVFLGMWTVGWFSREFGRDLKAAAAEQGTCVEALLCAEAESVPPGSDGVMSWPRWAPGLQNAHEAGTWVGLRQNHTRAHMFRALVEGIVLDLRRGLELLESGTGERVTSLRVGGGGSRSDLMVQILADVTGLPVTRPASEELAARGAALVAAVGGGVHPSMNAAVAAMVPDAPVVTPDPAARAVYDRMYRDVFKPGFGDLRRIWKRVGRRM
jgi:sugar (pentulose or hexulose) kinase